MITFSIAAVLLSAVAALLILQRAAGAARRPDVDPTLGIYRRQLNEIDDLADRGLLAAGELRAARAEAGRRILHAAQAQEPIAPDAPKPTVSRNLRLAILAGAIAAPLLAAGLYVYKGSPGNADQPYRDRLKAWTDSDPSQLDAERMAAVLQTIVKAKPGEVEPLVYLARAQASYGNVPAATETMRHATRLAPKQAELWADLGQLMVMQTNGQENEASSDAFKQALALDPKLPSARYHLARFRIAHGDLNGGLNDWRALLADVPEGDEHKALAQEIDATAKAGHLVAAPAPAPGPVQQQAEAGGAPGPDAAGPQGAAPAQDGGIPPEGSDQRKFILSMVARLDARLQQAPDDPAGWARLIRSYAILGDAPKMQAALDRAHQVFKNRPNDLKTVDNAMAGGQ